MREGREIATGADRTFFWNNRMHAAIQHLAKHLNDLEPKTAQGVPRNSNIREFAKTRRHSVNDRITRNYFFDDFARRENTRPGETRNLNFFSVERHTSDVGEC